MQGVWLCFNNIYPGFRKEYFITYLQGCRPESLITAMAPVPGGVVIAAMVSFSNINFRCTANLFNKGLNLF
jgi:hypothetical protein